MPACSAVVQVLLLALLPVRLVQTRRGKLLWRPAQLVQLVPLQPLRCGFVQCMCPSAGSGEWFLWANMQWLL